MDLLVFRSRRSGALLTALLLSLVLAAPVAAQAEADAPPPIVGPVDRLEHQAPRTSLRGYLTASRAGDYGTAAEYLDLSRMRPGERAERGPELARELKVVLDRTLWVELEKLSEQPGGAEDDGLPELRDRVGVIRTEAGAVDIFVDRMAGPEGAPIWKIAATTVERIPDLYDEFGYGPLGEWLPEPLFTLSLLEIQLWQWIGLLSLIFVAYLFAWFAARVALGLARPLVARSDSTLDDRLLEVVAPPVQLLVGLALFAAGNRLLGLALPAENFFRGLEKTLAVLAVTWLMFRLVDLSSSWMSNRLASRGRLSATAVLPMGRRVVKALLGVLAFLSVLQNFGVNVTGLLAGLGFGGLAFALAAQKTLENAFGGVTVLADQPVRVGDFCRFGDRVGTVEDIGLRSTRIRTLDRTVVTVPNAEFSTLQLENFAPRDRFWFHPRLGLRYETTPEQIRYVLVELRRMLYAHPAVDPDPARVRFVGFGASSLDIDLFVYVRAADYAGFLEVAEDLNLRVMDIIERAGTGFAFPSQTLYVGRDHGLDEKAARTAEREVARWREEEKLFLPGFPPEEIEALRGTLDYPNQGSAVKG